MNAADPLSKLREEVQGAPHDVGARLRLGAALMASGLAEEGAKQLRLAAKLDPGNPHVALMAVGALVACGREREAALLISTQIRRARTCTRVAPSELAILEALLCHPQPFVRCHAARAFGRLRIAQTIDALERACRDENSAVRLAASDSLRLLMAH